MTAAQAIATGSSAGSGGTYPLFKMGASCWYFGQRLSELGVTAPIGLADTAIGGQRIEEYVTLIGSLEVLIGCLDRERTVDSASRSTLKMYVRVL